MTTTGPVTQQHGTMLYTPGVRILIAVSATGEILDVSNDIESGNLTINENNPHSLNFTLSNQGGKYGGIFTPNDKIIVQMKRVTWMQTFAGYLDEVPYYQVYPGSINLSATCTLKRLKFHSWDPAYIQVVNFIQTAFTQGFASVPASAPTTTVTGPNGKQETVPTGDILSNQSLTSATDAGMKAVLMNILVQVIGWDQAKIHIGGVPQDWINQLQPIWNDFEIAQTNNLIQSLGAQASSTAIGTGATVAGINVGSGQVWTAADWASATIQIAGGVPNSNNISNFLHWMGAENYPTTWYHNFNPLNCSNGPSGSATGSYANLYQAAVYTAQNIQGTLATSGGASNASTILPALQNPTCTLAQLAAACIKSNWCGGNYNNDPTKITGVTIMPDQPAPSSGGPVQGIPQSDYMTSGTGTSSTTTNQTGTANTGGGAAQATSSTTAMLLASAGSGSTTGPTQITGAVQAIAYANSDSTSENGQDCSAFTQACWNAAGVSIPRTSEGQYNWNQLVLVPVTQIVPGDLLFGHFGYYSPPGHVAIYVGGGQVIQHDPVRTSSLSDWITGAEGQAGQVPGGGFYGVGRIVPTAGTNNATGSPITVSASDLSNAGSGTASTAAGNSTGLAADANGDLIYGSGQWDPAGQGSNTNDSLFTGAKVLMLDQPIMPYINDVCKAALRHYCSAPNGDFIAWFPDYFGQYGLAGTWHLSLVELLDFTVSWSDSNLVTHQYVAGAESTQNTSFNPLTGGNITLESELRSYGVATIDMPGLLQALTGVNPSDPGIFSSVDAIYRQFGARPQFTAMPTVAAPALASFWFAVSLFQQNWANQFSCDVQMTFMPELWPGMLLAIDALNFQCYINSVTHSWSMQDDGGFQTQATVSAPSTTLSGPQGVGSSQATGGLVGLARAGRTVA